MAGGGGLCLVAEFVENVPLCRPKALLNWPQVRLRLSATSSGAFSAQASGAGDAMWVVGGCASERWRPQWWRWRARRMWRAATFRPPRLWRRGGPWRGSGVWPMFVPRVGGVMPSQVVPDGVGEGPEEAWLARRGGLRPGLRAAHGGGG